MKFNFTVRAVAWDTPDKDKRKDRDKHKNKDKSVIENDTVPAGEYNFLQGWDDGPKVTVK